MTNNSRPVLVFGATGNQGGSVARALLLRNRPIRAFVRDINAPKAVDLQEAGAELVQGDHGDADALRSAMTNVHGVFAMLPSNLDQEEEVRLGRLIVDIAAESHVAHLVYSSGASVGETLTGIPRFDAKPQIEAHVRAVPIPFTIVRPMIFMDMLLRPVYGLSEGQYRFFLRADQSMQLIALDDIGKFVAAIFADSARYGGQTMKIASDTVSGRDLQVLLSEASGREIRYSQFSAAFLAANPDLNHMSASLVTGPLSKHVDLAAMRKMNPEILSFRSWLFGAGGAALDQALRKI